MDKDGILKWVLIAGAAYLLYRYLQGQGIIGQPQDGLLVVGPQPGSEAREEPEEPAAAEDRVLPPIEEEELGVPFGLAQSLAESVTALGYNPAHTFTGHEWGYFWKSAAVFNGLEVGPTEMGLRETQKVYIAEAVRRMQDYFRRTFQAAGVSGLPLSARARFAQAWGGGWTN